MLIRLTDRLLRARREWVQFVSTLVINSYFFSGTLKAIPCWGFNCYACPAASFACPIGSLQHFVILRQIPFYVLGVIGLAGALWGRLSCGWMCPFGFIQDLLHKLGGILRIHRRHSDHGVSSVDAPSTDRHNWTRLRYVLLVALVIVIPFLTYEPWFCKLCPAGMLEAGIPVVLTQPMLREGIGWLYYLKFVILIGFLAWMMVIKRPFCRYICPLGAIWSPFNRVSAIKLMVDQEHCSRCDRCRKACPVNIGIYEDPNAEQCIRCLQCIKACPQQVISVQDK
jgi:polyferredoxin